MPDSAAIYSAVSAKLLADAPLAALMPDGIYRDVSASGKTDFVIISKSSDERSYMFQGVAYEEFTYLVKAVSRSKSGLIASQAAARIFALLQFGSLTITGYTLMVMKLSEENGTVEISEPDEDDRDMRWQHRGWYFDVTVSPT